MRRGRISCGFKTAKRADAGARQQNHNTIPHAFPLHHPRLLWLAVVVALATGWWLDGRGVFSSHESCKFKLSQISDDPLMRKANWSDAAVDSFYQQFVRQKEIWEEQTRRSDEASKD